MGFQSHFNICNSTIAPRVNPKRNVTMYLIFQACLQDLQRMQSINRHYKAVNTTQINFTIDITSKINMVISSSRLKMIIIIQKGILHHITSDEGILFVLRPTPFMNILHTCTIYLISRYVVHLSYVCKYVVDVCEIFCKLYLKFCGTVLGGLKNSRIFRKKRVFRNEVRPRVRISDDRYDT